MYLLKWYATSRRARGRRGTDETNAVGRRSRERGRAKGRDDAEQRQNAEQRRESTQSRDESRRRAETRADAEQRYRQGAEQRREAETTLRLKAGRVPCNERERREQEFAGEKRCYIGSTLSARGNDCHARAKGMDRGARCTPLTPLTRELTRNCNTNFRYFNIIAVGSELHCGACFIHPPHKHSKEATRTRLCKSSPFRNVPVIGTHLGSPREGLSCISIYFSLHYSSQRVKICTQISGGLSHGRPYKNAMHCGENTEKQRVNSKSNHQLLVSV